MNGDAGDLQPEGPQGVTVEELTSVEAVEVVEVERAPDTGAADETEDVAVVVAVTDEFSDAGDVIDEGALEQLAQSNRDELDHTLADQQQELAGMARTGIPGVDAALDQLAGLDPNDLQGSSELLAEVLAKLESVMSETPQE